MEDFYDLLGVAEDASAEEIDRAWRRKVRTYHPDVNDDTRANAQFKTLKKAHETLSDETERAAYDRMGHESYVRRRLDGLPTKGQPQRPDATAEPKTDAAAESDAAANDDATANGNAAASDPDAGTSARAADRRTATGRTAGERTRSRDSAESRRSGRRSSESARSNASGGGRGRHASAGSGGRGTARDATTGGSNAGGSGSEARGPGSTSSRATRSASRLTPLSYGWTAVLLAGVLYVAGLWRYLRANAEALAALRRAAAADPMAAATATQELVAPGQFVLESVTVGEPLTLLFPIGTVVLAVALAGVVHSFGRGVAYLYALGGLLPLFALAAGPMVTLPDGAVLGLVCVCPLLATAAFLVDVGRVAF